MRYRINYTGHYTGQSSSPDFLTPPLHKSLQALTIARFHQTCGGEPLSIYMIDEIISREHCKPLYSFTVWKKSHLSSKRRVWPSIPQRVSPSRHSPGFLVDCTSRHAEADGTTRTVGLDRRGVAEDAGARASLDGDSDGERWWPTAAGGAAITGSWRNMGDVGSDAWRAGADGARCGGDGGGDGVDGGELAFECWWYAAHMSFQVKMASA